MDGDANGLEGGGGSGGGGGGGGGGGSTATGAEMVVLDVSHREDVVLGGGASLSKNDLAAPIDIDAATGGKD